MTNQKENPYYNCPSIQNITSEDISELLKSLSTNGISIEKTYELLKNLNAKRATNSKKKKDLISKAKIGDINENTNLFRIMPFKFLLQSIEIEEDKSKQFTLVKASEWNKNDPLEYYLRNKIMKDGTRFSLLSEQLYGSCFSIEEESIKLWNVFGGKDKTEPYVKIKTTYSKFMNSFYDEEQEHSILDFFALKICYVDKKDIENISEGILEAFEKTRVPDYKNDIDISFLHVFPSLIKSKEFEYEQEVRFIRAKMMGFNDPYYHFKIDPNEFFDEIVFSPWVLDTDFEKYKKQLIDLHYTGIIKKSNLTKF